MMEITTFYIMRHNQRFVDLIFIEYDNVQVAVVMLGALAVGTIIGYGAAITNIFSGKSEIRALKNKNRHLSDELNDLRNAAIDEEIYDSENRDE